METVPDAQQQPRLVREVIIEKTGITPGKSRMVFTVMVRVAYQRGEMSAKEVQLRFDAFMRDIMHKYEDRDFDFEDATEMMVTKMQGRFGPRPITCEMTAGATTSELGRAGFAVRTARWTWDLVEKEQSWRT